MNFHQLKPRYEESVSKDKVTLVICMLTPEQKRALNTLIPLVPRWKDMFYQHPTPPNMVQTNFVGFSHVAFRLPRSEEYSWNQSSGKVTVQMNEHSEITIQKMNSKRRKGCATNTSYKFWLYSLGSSNLPPHLFAIWCEKGDTPDEPTPQQEKPDALIPTETEHYSFPHLPGVDQTPSTENSTASGEDDLRVEELSFLRPWVNEELAREFGWMQE